MDISLATALGSLSLELSDIRRRLLELEPLVACGVKAVSGDAIMTAQSFDDIGQRLESLEIVSRAVADGGSWSDAVALVGQAELQRRLLAVGGSDPVSTSPNVELF